MKWPVGITVVVVLAALVAAQTVKNDRAEKAADKSFQEAAGRGEVVFREACTACHEGYDPRFYVYDEWARLLADRGCPRVPVPLDKAQVGSIKDFFRKRAAPSEDEAETVRYRVRARFRKDRVERGSVLYGKRCVHCHEHPFFVKVRTTRGWRDVVDDLASFHPGVDEPVWVDPEKEAVDLIAFLESRAAGTVSDARAIGKLLASGAGPAEVDVEPELHEIRWERDYKKGMLEAKKKNKPVILDLTDLSGG